MAGAAMSVKVREVLQPAMAGIAWGAGWGLELRLLMAAHTACCGRLSAGRTWPLKLPVVSIQALDAGW